LWKLTNSEGLVRRKEFRGKMHQRQRFVGTADDKTVEAGENIVHKVEEVGRKIKLNEQCQLMAD
jgi:hypothetical protein